MRLIRYFLLIPGFLIFLSCGGIPPPQIDDFQIADDLSPCSEATQYFLTFESFWSAETHPNEFPYLPHFSPLVGGTHNAAVSFWSPGGIASPGMEAMGERGEVSPLDQEVQIQMDQGNAGIIIRGDPIPETPGVTTSTFGISGAFPLVTVVSMIGPSPDWFVGVHDMSLCGPDGNWINAITMTLETYDAGTDDGTEFVGPNIDTQPKEPIQILMEGPLVVGDSVPPMGQFTFQRVY